MSNPTVRSEQRLVVSIVAVILGPLFVLGPTGLGVAFVIVTAASFGSLLVLPFGMVLSFFAAYHMLRSYHWVELDAGVIRGVKFWTRKYIERKIEDVSQIVPLHPIDRSPVSSIINKLLGRVRGYEVHFTNGATRITLVRHDMTNVDFLIGELLKRKHSPARS
jgi:hypothetical protein